MSRTVLAIDRVVCLVLAAVLLAGGAAGLWWWSGRSGLGDAVDTAPVADVTGTAWWPAVVGAAGVVLILVGLRWLLAHARRTAVRRLPLRGSDRGGRLDVEAGKVASAAADAFADTLGVRSARGTVVRDRGQLVVRIIASIDHDADLRRLAEHADRMAADLAGVLERPELRCSIELRIPRVPLAGVGSSSSRGATGG